ncbi:MAG: ATP-binding protein [Acidobacteriota bacterium]
MIVAIASGTGGTGKTTVALNLALSVGRRVRILDCDVEAPNVRLFIDAETVHRVEVGIPVPLVDSAACNQCGECSRLCQYNALAVLGNAVMVFPELCHGCGGCARVCPEGAIREVPRSIGVVEEARMGDLCLVQGRLHVGEALVPPLIRAVRARPGDEEIVLIDAPPGTSCSMIAAVRGCDFVVLVTEPTPFGLNDLMLAVKTVRAVGIPFGVVINRAGSGDGRVHEYCAAEDIEILLEIPDDRRVAEAYARGLPLVESVPELRPLFATLASRIEAETSFPETVGRENGRTDACA